MKSGLGWSALSKKKVGRTSSSGSASLRGFCRMFLVSDLAGKTFGIRQKDGVEAGEDRIKSR